EGDLVEHQVVDVDLGTACRHPHRQDPPAGADQLGGPGQELRDPGRFDHQVGSLQVTQVGAAVDGDVGAETGRPLQLGGVDVDHGDVEPRDEVAEAGEDEAADRSRTEQDHAVAGAGAGAGDAGDAHCRRAGYAGGIDPQPFGQT